jgi:hypothetical protein
MTGAGATAAGGGAELALPRGAGVGNGTFSAAAETANGTMHAMVSKTARAHRRIIIDSMLSAFDASAAFDQAIIAAIWLIHGFPIKRRSIDSQ